MKKIFPITLMVFVLLHQFIFAQSLKGIAADNVIKGSEEVLPGKYSTIPEFVKFRDGNEISFELFDRWAHHNFNLPVQAGFKLLSKDNDKIGYTHYRYVQTWNKHVVEGTMYIVHVKAGVIKSMNGLIYNNLSNGNASITVQQGLQSALSFTNASVYKWQEPGSEKEIQYITGNPSASYYPAGELVYASERNDLNASQFKLTYKYDIYASKPLSRNYVFVDAQNGKVINSLARLHDADVVATAVTKYSGTREITTDSVNATTYRLREVGRGNGIETYDLQGGTTGTGIDFLDTDNYWNNVNPQQDEVATDAHFAAEMTYDYYWLEHGRNSIDNNGFKLISRVHYDVGYVNAFWDGTQMTYGDGNGAPYTPLTSLDIGGHEITHGLTENSANLVYSYESGALNESFSDVFGNTIRQYGKQSPVFDWLIGDEIGGTPFRSMSNPNQYGDPDTYQGNNWATGPGDNGGVHTNSGVQNYWYYLMVAGGVGTNDNGDAFNITGMGIDTAADIAFRNLTVYLTPNSQYADARFYAIQSAIDLYGPCTYPVITTANAWYAVGVGNAFTPGVTSDFIAPVTDFCAAPATVQFNNASSNAGYFTWSFGDGNSSTDVNPVHTYQNYGTYDVQLIADGGTCGVDSVLKSTYILVDSNIPCNIIMDPGFNGTQTSCDGNLYDTGGPTGDYSDNEDTYITIAPVNASQITLTFTQFNFENNFDYLYIYDGPSTASPLIGQYTGGGLPNGGVINSTGGTITIRQFTDQGLTASGFALSWQCTYPNAAPIVNFIADDTVSCTGAIQFTDKSFGGPIAWFWDFGDSNTSTSQNPLHTYSANGTYNVKLIATNTIGSDSLIKSSYITVNMPTSPVAADTTICAGTSALLSASGSGTIMWYDQPSGGPLLYAGPVFPTPVLGGTTTYYVGDAVFSPAVHEGPLDNTIGGGNNYQNNTDRYLIFNCYVPCKLLSVWVLAVGDGNRTIELRDNAGIVLQSATVFIPDGGSRVNLDFDIPVGTDLQLGKQGAVNLYRNNSGAVFPYNVSGLVSITNTNAGAPGYYYFFYDWELAEYPCVSPLTAVTVNVNPAPTANFSLSQNLNIVDFTDLSTGATTWSWDFGDSNSSTQQNPQHIYTAPGIYTVVLTVSNGICTVTKTMLVNVTGFVGINEMQADEMISVSPNPAEHTITVNFGNAFRSGSLQIFNAVGELISSNSLKDINVNYEKNMDVSNLRAGVYTLKLSTESNTSVVRFIKR